MELLLQWIDSLGIDAPTNGVESAFSNGFMFGKLLHATNQLSEAEWRQFVNDDKSDSKIRNYCLLLPKMRQLGIKFDAQLAQAVMRRTSGVAPRLLYELQSAIRPLARARVGRSRPGQQRLLRPAARSHKPGYEAKQAEIFERNLRVMAENQNDVLLAAHMSRQASNVSSLQAARDQAHAARLAAHRQRLEDKRAERLHMLRTRHMVTHAREEAGIREWQRNQEIRLAQTLAKRAFQEKTAVRRAARQDAQRRSAREEAHEGIAEFEALAAEQGVAPAPRPPAPQELAASIAAHHEALQDAPDGPREDSSDPIERRDALHARLSRKLAATKEAPAAARPPAGRASGMQQELAQRAHRRRAFAMHSRDRRLQLHAAQRHEQVTSLLAWRCGAELELDDVVSRILKHEVIFRENRAARARQVQSQRAQDAQLEAERQRMAVQQHREQFAADLADACADMQAAGDARDSVQHQRAVAVARSAVLKVVDAAVAIAEAREAAGMRLTQAGATAHTCSATLPALSAGAHGDAEGGEGKEEQEAAQPPSAEALVQPHGGADAVSWLQTRVAYVHDGALQPAVAAAQPLPLALADVAPEGGATADAGDAKKAKKGKKGEHAEEDAHAAAAAAAQARALQHMQLQLLGAPSPQGASGEAASAAVSPRGAHEDGEEDSEPLCGVQLPHGACVALMGALGDEAAAPSAGGDEGAAASLELPAGASASLSFFHGSAADARAALEEHEEWGEGEEAARRRIRARSRGRDGLSALRTPSAATAGHSVALGQTMLYDTHSGDAASDAEDAEGALEGKSEGKADSGAGGEIAAGATKGSDGGAVEVADGGADDGDALDSCISLHLFKTYLQRAAFWGHGAPRGDVQVDSSQFEAALAPLLSQYPQQPEAEDDTAAAKKSPKSKSKADKGAVDIQLPPPHVHGELGAQAAQDASAQVLADVVARLSAAVQPPAAPAAVCDVPQFPLTMALLGPPGSGVTTHSRFLAAAFNLRLIQPRALITQALALADGRLPLEHCTLPPPHAAALQLIGKHARDALRAGQAVPDVLVVQAIVTAVRAAGGAVVDPTLAAQLDSGDGNGAAQHGASEDGADAPAACQGWILDGFPGTVAQACLLEEALTWHTPQLAAGQRPGEIIPGQGQWCALRGAAGAPSDAHSPAASAVEALVAGRRQPHPVLDADADEEGAAASSVDDPRCSSDTVPPAPRHAHGVKLVLTLGMSRDAALRRVLGLRVDGQRLVTMAAVDDEVPVGHVSAEEGKVSELGGATATGEGVYGLEVVDSTVKAGARGLNAAAAAQGAGGLSVKVAPSAEVDDQAGGASAAVAPREPTASGAFISSAHQGGSAVLSASGVPALPLSGSVAAVDDIGPEGDAAAVPDTQHDSAVLDDGVMQVSPAALLPVLPEGYVVRGKSGNVVYHLDSNPPPHKCKTVVQMSPPWAVPLQGRAQLNASLAEGTPVLQPAQLALVMERYWSTQGDMAAFYDAQGRGHFACVSAYKPCSEQDAAQTEAVSSADGTLLLDSATWEEYGALGAWAAGRADALNEAELFAVLKRVTGRFADAIQQREHSRAAEWEATKTRRAAALAAHAERMHSQLAHRRGEDAHAAVVTALEEAAAAAAAEAEAAAEAKKNKGAKGKGDAAAEEGKEDDAAAAPVDGEAAADASDAPAAEVEGKEAEPPAGLDVPFKYVPALPVSGYHAADAGEDAATEGKPAGGGVSFAASVSFAEGKDADAPEEGEADEATQLAAQAASIVVVPTRHADPAVSALPVAKSLTALHALWQTCARHYARGSQDALRGIAMEQRGVLTRLGAVQRFLLRFLRRPVRQYEALMRHAQAAVNAPSWEERMGPAAARADMSPAEALLDRKVQHALAAEAAASKKPAGKGDKNAAEPESPSAEEEAVAAANAAAARRAELAEVVELAACGMLAVASARREAAAAYIAARKRDAWGAHVKSALAARLCELLQVESDRLVGERLVLLGYFRALDGADGVGIWTGHNARPAATAAAEDSLGGKSPKGKDKKARGGKDGEEDAMPDASEACLQLQRLLEGRALHAGAVAAPLQAAGAAHPALPQTEADERPGSSLKQKRSKSPKLGKDAGEEASAWPVSDAHAPKACLLAPPVSPCLAVVPVAAPADVLPALGSVPAVEAVLPDDADALWAPVRDAAAAAAAAAADETSAPSSARSGTPKGKSRQGGSRHAAEEGASDGVQHLSLGWASPSSEECDWDEVHSAAADAMQAVQGVLQSAVHGVGVHVGVADDLSQELLRVMDACCASAARAALASTAARHHAAQDAALEEALAAASDSKGKKGKGGKGKKPKGGGKDKKGKKGDEAPADPAVAALQWKASACPVQEDSGLRAVQDAIAVCERLGAAVLQLVHAAAETQEIQRQRHAAEAVARERRRRRLLNEAAAAAEAAAAEAAAEAEAAAAAAAAESLGSGKKGAKSKPKDKSKDKKAGKDKKGGKGASEVEESHLPPPDVTHATVDPAVWSAIVQRVQLFRSRCQYIGELATQLLASVDAAAERAWAACAASVDALLQQEVQAIGGFRATALRAVATGARLPYKLCFTRPHAGLDLDLLPTALSSDGGAQHAIGVAASALAQGGSVVPTALHVPGLSGAVVGGLHQYQLPHAAELGRLVPHAYPVSMEASLAAAHLAPEQEDGKEADADADAGAGFRLLVPADALLPAHAPPCAAPDAALHEKLQDFFKLHFQVDVTQRVLPPPTAEPRAPLLLEDSTEDAALRPRPSQLYAFALRLRRASLQGTFGGAYHARAYNVAKADLWPSPPPMVSEATQLTDGASEDGDAEDAAASSLSSAKGGKDKSLKSKDKKGGKDKAAEEEAAAIAAAVRSAQAAVLAAEQELQGEELVPPGTFLAVEEFVQVVRDAVAADELPAAWGDVPDSTLAAVAQCFVSDLAEWAPWEVRVEQEPLASVAARKAYAAWQLREVERLLAEEAAAQARADADEAQRLGITAAEVAEMREAAERGEEVSLAPPGEEQGDGDEDAQGGHRAGSVGSRSGASTPRSAASEGSAPAEAVDMQGSVALGSPLDVQELVALQTASVADTEGKADDGAAAQDGKAGSVEEDAEAQQPRADGPLSPSVQPVDAMQAEAAAEAEAAPSAVQLPPSPPPSGGVTPDDTLRNFARLCPGPASWPWQEPSTITPRRRVVLHHPLLHHQVPLRIAPHEWEALVKQWGDGAAAAEASAQPTTAHHRSLAQALQAALEDAKAAEAKPQSDMEEDTGVAASGGAASPLLSAGTATPMGDFGQVAWPPVMQDLTTSGFVAGVQPVTVAGLGAVWIDFDASYSAAVAGDDSDGHSAAGGAHEDSTAAFEADAAAGGAAPQLSLRSSASLDSAQQPPLELRTAQAVQQGTADALRQLYPPANFKRLVDWRGVVAWLSITGPSPVSTSFLEATLSAVHADSKHQHSTVVVSAATSAGDGAAGSAAGSAVQAALWSEGVQGGRDYIIQDITGFSTLVGKGWGVATWPRHEQLDELAASCERIAQQQLAATAAAPAPASDAPQEEDGKAAEQASDGLAVDTAPAEAPVVPLRGGQVFVVPPQLTPHAATPLQPAAAEPEEEQGTPRSRKAKAKKGGGKGGGKGAKKGGAEEEAPLLLQLRPTRQWADPVGDMGPPGAMAEEALLPEAAHDLPLWFQCQGLHEKSEEDALADIAAAAAAQGSDFGAAAATAEAEVDALIGTVSAQRAAANEETGGAVGWHHVSGDHSSREALLLADLSARARALRELQEAETQRYTQLADRDVQASVQYGDRIMRGVLLQALSDVYGRLDFGRLLRHWRRHVQLQEQLLREEAEEGLRGRASRQSADDGASGSADAAAPAPVRFCAAARSAAEVEAEAAADKADAALPPADDSVKRDMLMDVYAVLQRSAEEQRAAAADAAARAAAEADAARMLEQQGDEAEEGEEKEQEGKSDEGAESEGKQ